MSKPVDGAIDERWYITRAPTLQSAVDRLIRKHGSVRAAARVLRIDHVYLWRLAKGDKDNPSAALLKKLRLRKVVAYEWADATKRKR